MSDLGRMLVFFGLLLVAIGLALIAFSRLNLPLGRLPGDFTWRGSNWSVSFPLMTSIILSLALSFILWLINHFRR
ncbi:MAG TPA: DUF2905 domain-containing protein [Edaphobacter sp.]